jgi:UDP-N-acetylmuramate dehydrogenase
MTPPATIEHDVPMAPLTTLGVGGPARYLVRAGSVDDIVSAVSWASSGGIPLFILSGGSNLLVSDDGFPGLVLKMDLRGISSRDEGGRTVVRAAAGEPWDPFVEAMVAEGLAGVECLSGIPGLVGATPIQNVGAYGQDVSETITRVEGWDRRTGRIVFFSNGDCRFSYRNSLFKAVEPERYIILSVTYAFRRGGHASVKYPELRNYLEEGGRSLTDLGQVREAVLAIRRRKGMVLDPDDPDTCSDGSFFTNPLVDPATAERIKAGGGGEMPHFPAPDGMVKLSAAWLIENSGFAKGYVRGRAGLSSKHTLAIINRGGATAAEVLALVREIQAAVTARFGVKVVPEPNFVGFPGQVTSSIQN